jgi:hypothetical protein
MVKMVSYKMSGMYCVQNSPFQHGWDLSLSILPVSACLEWNVLWSLLSVSAWMEFVVVKIVHLSMYGMCSGQNCQF